MLLFELFPALMLIVTIVMGIALFVLDRRARREESGDAQGARHETQKTSDRQ